MHSVVKKPGYAFPVNLMAVGSERRTKIDSKHTNVGHSALSGAGGLGEALSGSIAMRVSIYSSTLPTTRQDVPQGFIG